jgi:hypothetical protein
MADTEPPRTGHTWWLSPRVLAKGLLLTVALWVVVDRTGYVIECLRTPRSYPQAVPPLGLVILIVLLVGFWLGHELTGLRRLQARRATEVTAHLRDVLVDADDPLTDDECDAVLMRFQEMGLLTLGVTDGEITVQETPIGSLYRDLFS